MILNNGFEMKLAKVWTRTIERHNDDRGIFLEFFRQSQNGKIDVSFIQDSVSFSKKNVLRGLHIQENQWQLSTLLKGSAKYFVLDTDPNSDQYMKLETISLSPEGISQVLAAPGIAHGFFVESSEVVMSYKTSTYYDEALQHGINFSSFKELAVMIADSIRSKRDEGFIELRDFQEIRDLKNSSQEIQSRLAHEL
jgi:dTDP-4-dehydrorhamnose 3,5-epimerase